MSFCFSIVFLDWIVFLGFALQHCIIWDLSFFVLFIFFLQGYSGLMIRLCIWLTDLGGVKSFFCSFLIWFFLIVSFNIWLLRIKIHIFFIRLSHSHLIFLLRYQILWGYISVILTSIYFLVDHCEFFFVRFVYCCCLFF